MIYAVLSHFDFVAKFTVKNLNTDFTNTVGERGGHRFVKCFHKIPLFLVMASLNDTLIFSATMAAASKRLLISFSSRQQNKTLGK